MKKLITLFLTFTALQAQAIEGQKFVDIRGGGCLNAPINSIKASFLNYQHYHTVDDRMNFPVPIPFLSEKQVEMVSSRAQEIAPWTQEEIAPIRNWVLARDHDKLKHYPELYYHVIDLKFRPAYMEEDAQLYYPRFSMECELGAKVDGLFQRCQLIERESALKNGQIKNNANRFGMKKLLSRIMVTENHPECASSPGKTKIEYYVWLATHAQEVNLIKSYMLNSLLGQWAGESDFLKAVVDKMFKEDEFFSQYYTLFYTDWMQSLTK